MRTMPADVRALHDAVVESDLVEEVAERRPGKFSVEVVFDSREKARRLHLAILDIYNPVDA